jgi:hypothetical protein
LEESYIGTIKKDFQTGCSPGFNSGRPKEFCGRGHKFETQYSSVVFSYFLSIADISPLFYAFGSFYSHLYRNCNSKACGARAKMRLLFFKRGFKLFTLILYVRILNMVTKTWRVC